MFLSVLLGPANALVCSKTPRTQAVVVSTLEGNVICALVLLMSKLQNHLPQCMAYSGQWYDLDLWRQDLHPKISFQRLYQVSGGRQAPDQVCSLITDRIEDTWQCSTVEPQHTSHL